MNRPAIWLAIAATLVHIVASLHYGYFRDELYFIACAHHLAWGYVDQPPLVAIAAWLASPFGYALIALRFLPALAAGGTVFFTCGLARALGGNRFAEIATGIAAFLLPANLFLGSTLTTTSFEPFTWTLTMYLLVCIIAQRSLNFAPQRYVRNDNKGGAGRWYWLVAIAVFSFYAKYSIVLLLLSLVLALLLTRERKLFLDPKLYIAASIGALATLPNIVWQGLHGWPIGEVLHNDVVGRHAYNSGFIFQASGFMHNAFLFALEQLVFTNPLLVPIWFTGLVVLLIHPRFTQIRFIGISYAILFIFAILLEAKSYYIAGIYPSLCAAGIAFIFSLQKLGAGIFGEGTSDRRTEPWMAGVRIATRMGACRPAQDVQQGRLPSSESAARRAERTAVPSPNIPAPSFLGQILTIVLLTAATTLAPLALPILPPQSLITYEIKLGIKEARGTPPRLAHPLFAEEFGWNELAQHVARIYNTLPASERAHTALFADNYGDAGALDFYGPRYGLPPALSGQNSYYLWSIARLDAATSQPTTLIAVGATQAAELRASFREVRLVVTYLHPYRWSAEGPTPIFLCRFPVEPLGRIFPRFRWYGA